MRVLVIDSHKGSRRAPTQNLHWQNAQTVAATLGADLIWSYPEVNADIRGGYDRIVFVHASHYAYTDYAWLEASPNAELFYLTNEYNLGEPRTLWMAAKRGRKYTVIANHPSTPSKIVLKYVKDWHIVNLNALCYRAMQVPTTVREGCVYYGSFRKDRTPYFQKYLQAGRVVVSTHAKNIEKFKAIGVEGPFVGRLNIAEGALASFATSLYIEDTTTHTHYNFLANRFYESLMWDAVPVFDESCRGTVEQSGYAGGVFISGPHDLPTTALLPAEWKTQAAQEHVSALLKITQIIEG